MQRLSEFDFIFIKNVMIGFEEVRAILSFSQKKVFILGVSLVETLF